jgi:hypothetical protein
MATQIRSSIAVLLVARRERQDDVYGDRKFLWTLMRHFRAVALLASCMAEAPVPARLVSPARLAHGLRASRLTAAT